MAGKPRPFKVRWFSPHWNQYTGRSFAYAEKAIDYAKTIEADGGLRILVWENNPDGTVKWTLWRASDPPNG